MLRLQQLLHFPDSTFKSIHVAGTNGKGSVCTKIAVALQQAGYRTGLYTSPHLSCFRERIRINNEMISEDTVEELLEILFQISEREGISATFFELTTCLAFLYFANENVDVAVIETGLGGRLDATNIITPQLSVITSISLDHTDILGSTIEAIVKEKGGIIKPGVPIVIGPNVPQNEIREIAQRNHAEFIPCRGSKMTFEEENCLIARESLKVLQRTFSLPSEAIEAGLEGKQPCRFEVVDMTPPTILDVAHNPNGLNRLFDKLNIEFPQLPIRLLFGLSKNKDLEACIAFLSHFGSSFHIVEAENGRGAPKELLAKMLEKRIGCSKEMTLHNIIRVGIKEAQQKALQKGEVLVICGSFFIMSAVRDALGFNDPIDEICMNERCP